MFSFQGEGLRLVLWYQPHLAGKSQIRWQPQVSHRVWYCQTAQDCQHLVGIHKPHAVVAQTGTRDVAGRVAQACACAPRLPVLAMLSSPAGSPTRIKALQAGADACCDVDISWAELEALVRAASRRLTVAVLPVNPSVGWRLHTPRLLASPSGQMLILTPAESSLMQGLLTTPGGRLARPAGQRRGLDTIVARLKAKAEAQGMDLPLYSVRGWGYVFWAD